jgi:hypothetical protein
VPSELALVVADLVLDKAFPEEAVRDLHRLLGHTLSQRDPAAHRWDILHALTIIIREAEGDLPTAREYQTIREQRFPAVARPKPDL